MRFHRFAIPLVVTLAFPLQALATREMVADEPSVASQFTISHTAPLSCRPYAELPISARVISESPLEVHVAIFFRAIGSDRGYYWREMITIDAELYSVDIPARIVGNLGVEYYIVARRGSGVVQAGGSDSPFLVGTEYSYEGAVPNFLPGDEFLELYKPITDPAESSRIAQEAQKEPSGRSTLGLQVLLILILLCIGILIYQRLGR